MIQSKWNLHHTLLALFTIAAMGSQAAWSQAYPVKPNGTYFRPAEVEATA